MRRTRIGWRTAAIALTIGVVSASAGCAGASGAGAGSDDTLTIVVSSAPTSLDPAVNTNGGLVPAYETLAYESLIDITPDGEYVPALATEWGYLEGEEGRKYRVTLREDARFADGTEVTPQAVADSINYFVSSGKGPTVAAYAGITAEPDGDDAVLLTSETPNPIITELLTPPNYGGAIISPAGLEDSGQLQNASFGAGPYVYQPSQSVSGDQYVYTPNENYYDQDRIHFSKVVIKVISDATSALQAVRSGQADVMSVTADLVEQAESSGLQTFAKEVGWNGIFIADLGGNLVPALGDVRVRQALSHAIDREAIAQAVYGDLGSALVQPNTPGSDGFVEDLEEAYPYDVEKAKSLLAEAGYPDGIDIGLIYPNYQPDNAKVMQAAAQQLEQAGIRVQLKGEESVSSLISDMVSKEYATLTVNWGAMSEFLLYNQVFAPTAAINLWQHEQPGLAELVAAYSVSPEAERNAAAGEVQKLLVEQALSVPIAKYALAFATAPDIEGFGLDPYGTPNNPADWTISE
ncbi:ABC transporter substrate-binding protein [Microbacterium sp. RD1]|uniref:ABC transporter substrate-binding protein n=1 Tax=Microbacterium sp. RD1 TaxID=3457313 RepID=UPI003FA5D8F8